VIALAVTATGAAAGKVADRPHRTGAAAEPVGLSPAVESATGVGCGSTRSCTPSYGGALMFTTRNSCTAGLPVRDRRSGRWYVLTAGHCVAEAAGRTWRQSGLTLGRGTRWEYGALGTDGRASGSDVGLIRITANSATWRARSRVIVVTRAGARPQPIRAVRAARAGDRVCVTGGRSGTTRCGTVVAASTWLRYASPGLAARTVSNLALVSGICVLPGDSGSPVFAGSAVLGIAVARSNSGCYMWYSRIAAPLRHYGLQVVAG